MDVRRTCLVLLALLIPASARASGHNFDVYVAVSRVDPDSPSQGGVASNRGGLTASGVDSLDKRGVYGWHITGAATVKGHRMWAFVGDLSVHFQQFGEHAGSGLNQVTFMFGPRRTLLKNNHTAQVHAMLFGFRQSNGGNETREATTAAFALGGTVEGAYGRDEGKWGWRLQYDWLLFSRGRPQNRISIGGIRRFHF